MKLRIARKVSYCYICRLDIEVGEQNYSEANRIAHKKCWESLDYLLSKDFPFNEYKKYYAHRIAHKKRVETKERNLNEKAEQARRESNTEGNNVLSQLHDERLLERNRRECRTYYSSGWNQRN